MDIEIQQKILEVNKYLKSLSTESLDVNLLDPVARMMLVALLYEIQNIQDMVDGLAQKVTEKFCEDFIPRNEIGAIPAIALVNPLFRKNKVSDLVNLSTGVSFVSKHNGIKNPTTYLPVFANCLMPYDDIHILLPKRFFTRTQSFEVAMAEDNVIWVGINTQAEVETLKNFSLYIKGISGISPLSISVYSTECNKLDFCSMDRIEDVEMLEPFDAQQATNVMMSLVKHWKEQLLELPNSSLLFITDETIDRDVFKPKAFPRIFQNWLESEVLDYLDQNNNTLWLKIEYPKDYVIPDNCSVMINVVPVVNVEVSSVTLTQTSPIAKLQKQEDSFFLQILETTNSSQKQGFTTMSDEIIVRDFDASCYNDGELYRDIRNLYNHFIDDYYAFVEYNGLKDGEDIRRLKELINKIGKSVGTVNSKYKFDSGTYVMKNINQNSPSMVTKVLFLTTQGVRGNGLVETLGQDRDSKLECKKLPVVESYVPVIVSAMGGRDKADADTRYELLRYYSLTNDRLFTKMDIDAYIRKELMHEFGPEEFKRIYTKISIEGTGGATKVQRGLYIDIEFKDRKNYEKAVSLNFDLKMKQQISYKSCLSMPISVTLQNMEG